MMAAVLRQSDYCKVYRILVMFSLGRQPRVNNWLVFSPSKCQVEKLEELFLSKKGANRFKLASRQWDF